MRVEALPPTGARGAATAALPRGAGVRRRGYRCAGLVPYPPFARSPGLCPGPPGGSAPRPPRLKRRRGYR
ncbi:hypothetical protein Slala02_52050 [Streptomyces lavendulae subsp. lavendulae]|nr:hypothetical protein Slala01_23360 [Streptomyces lavendulae subsp. lavendulae]GLX29385.1 hypothetical protein Slala02_52050 [Streptomyces lavendulae subsp. lavendulae]